MAIGYLKLKPYNSNLFCYLKTHNLNIISASYQNNIALSLT